MSAFVDALAAAAADSRVTLTTQQLTACGVHFERLLAWNQAHNLTRITDAEEAARKHYLDCLVPLLACRDVGLAPPAFVDVGSGAGFPGLLAALVWPEAEATLVEPAQKRASFLVLAAAAMGAARVQVRAPVAARAIQAPLVLSRATFSPGGRAALTAYAAEDARVAVWGHHHDAATWKNEVGTWKMWSTTLQPYAVAGLEERCLLWAVRGESGVFHVKHTD